MKNLGTTGDIQVNSNYPRQMILDFMGRELVVRGIKDKDGPVGIG
jgi:hypothetical protein